MRAVLAAEEPAIQEFVDRLRCVPRFLAAENRKRGTPLNEHDLADLAQDTVVVILRKLHLFAGAAPLEGWLYRVCCLEFMNGLRRKWRGRAGGEGDEVAAVPARAGADLVAEREAIHGALERIDGAEAEVVRLKHFEDLTFEEMAARLETSPNTCKTRYYRGLSRLERLLADRGEAEHG